MVVGSMRGAVSHDRKPIDSNENANIIVVFDDILLRAQLLRIELSILEKYFKPNF